MFSVLERLYAYRKDPTHSLVEYIHVMYNKRWTYNEHYELSVEQQMWIVLNSFPNS